MIARPTSLWVWALAVTAVVHGCSTAEHEGTNTNWEECETRADCSPRAAGESFECIDRRCVYADGDTCLPAGDLRCGGTLPCPATWSEAEAAALPCLQGAEPALDRRGLLLRCGELDAIHFENSNYLAERYYDASGRLVGYQEANSEHGFCRSYDEVLTKVPDSCTVVTPSCFGAGSDAGDDAAPGDASPPEAGECKREPACDCPNAFEEAKRSAPLCDTPFPPGGGPRIYVERCGPYDVVVTAGIDSSVRDFYLDGSLVAEYHTGLSTLGCTWYGEGFVPPESCERVTPECLPDAAVPEQPRDGGLEGGSAADAGPYTGTCARETRPPCAGSAPCFSTLADGVQHLNCTNSRMWVARTTCGSYDAIVVALYPDKSTFYYDDSGILVGAAGTLGVQPPEGCIAYDDSFLSPPSCEPITDLPCFPQ